MKVRGLHFLIYWGMPYDNSIAGHTVHKDEIDIFEEFTRLIEEIKMQTTWGRNPDWITRDIEENDSVEKRKGMN